MGWASNHIERLKNGMTVQFRPSGNSMVPLIYSKQLVTVAPIKESDLLGPGDVVLCKVKGKEYLHKIVSIHGSSVTIGNNKGFINGQTGLDSIYGKLIKVEN